MSIQFQYSAIQCNTLQSSPAILKSSQTPLQLYSSPVILQYSFTPVQLHSSPALLQSSFTPVKLCFNSTDISTTPGDILYISRKHPVHLQEKSSKTPGNIQFNSRKHTEQSRNIQKVPNNLTKFQET